MADTYPASHRDTHAALRSSRGWSVALGVVLIVLGVMAAFNLLAATIASIYFVGALMVAGGLAQIIHPFRVRVWGRFALWVACGLLYTFAGLFAVLNPLLASSVLTLILGIALIAAGAARIVVELGARPERSWGWIVASGALTLLAGFVILVGWPVNSLWILGIFLAADLIFQGWAWLAIGLLFSSR